MPVEHVFPESIVGRYTIKTVCKKCNSDLGSKVDSRITDHWIVSVMRSFMGLSGKIGKVPTLFKHGYMVNDSSHVVIM